MGKPDIAFKELEMLARENPGLKREELIKGLEEGKLRPEPLPEELLWGRRVK